MADNVRKVSFFKRREFAPADVSREALLAAAYTVLVREGYDHLSFDSVAREAGTQQIVVYRWWERPADLAVEVFFATLDLQERGSAQEDFRAQISNMANQLRGPLSKALARSLAESNRSPLVSATIRKRWLGPRREWARLRMARAAEEGELQDGVEPRAALALLYSPLYSPLLFGNDIPSQKDLADCFDLAAQAIFRR